MTDRPARPFWAGGAFRRTTWHSRLMPGIHIDVASWDRDRQHLLNRWAVPARFTACPYPPGPIPVVARLRWSVDGDELHDGRATGWTSRLVLVEIVDRRLGINGVWLDVGDVRRR